MIKMECFNDEVASNVVVNELHYQLSENQIPFR
jgi:hypothetical protein